MKEGHLEYDASMEEKDAWISPHGYYSCLLADRLCLYVIVLVVIMHLPQYGGVPFHHDYIGMSSFLYEPSQLSFMLIPTLVFSLLSSSVIKIRWID